MTTADRIAAKFASARPKFADAFHADHYEIQRMTLVPDGYGGYVEEMAVVESGRCALDAVQGGTVAIAGTVMTASGRYVAEMPIETSLVANDVVFINGRKFAVMEDPKRGGEMGLFTQVALEARS